MSRKILVVDDEARIREVVQYALEREGYTVRGEADGKAALDALQGFEADLIVLDVMLPGIDGLEVCRRIRAVGQMPILFLSARSEEVDRIVGLELGGDDYLTKPFSPRELVARIRAILRRLERPGEPKEGSAPLCHGKLSLAVDRHEARYDGTAINLTATEFGLLVALHERPGIVLSRGQLMKRAYRFDNLVTERTIDTHVRRVRAKFRPMHFDPIATVYGVGYRAADP